VARPRITNQLGWIPQGNAPIFSTATTPSPTRFQNPLLPQESLKTSRPLILERHFRSIHTVACSVLESGPARADQARRWRSRRGMPSGVICRVAGTPPLVESGGRARPCLGPWGVANPTAGVMMLVVADPEDGDLDPVNARAGRLMRCFSCSGPGTRSDAVFATVNPAGCPSGRGPARSQSQ